MYGRKVVYGNFDEEPKGKMYTIKLYETNERMPKELILAKFTHFSFYDAINMLGYQAVKITKIGCAYVVTDFDGENPEVLEVLLPYPINLVSGDKEAEQA